MRARMAAIPAHVGGTSVATDPKLGPAAPAARNVIDIEAAGLGVVLPAGGLVRVAWSAARGVGRCWPGCWPVSPAPVKGPRSWVRRSWGVVANQLDEGVAVG